MGLTSEERSWFEQQFGAIGSRLDAVDKRLDAVDKRLDAVDKRLDAVDKRLDERIDGLTRYILDFRTETIQRFDHIAQQQNILASAVGAMETRLQPLTQAIHEFGGFSSQLSSQLWRARDASDSLAGRVARLEEQISRLNKPAA